MFMVIKLSLTLLTVKETPSKVIEHLDIKNFEIFFFNFIVSIFESAFKIKKNNHLHRNEYPEPSYQRKLLMIFYS